MVAAFGITALGLGRAWAGYKVPPGVPYIVSGHTASGALGMTRDTADNAAYLECYVTSWGGAPTLTCDAGDGHANASCTTTNAAFVSMYDSVTSDAFVYFSGDSSGNCTYMEFGATSEHAPKVL